MDYKGHFSFEDDPSFSGFTEKDWEEWKKNSQHLPSAPCAICVGCLNQVEGGGCDIYNEFAQRDIILKGECEDRIS